MAFEIKWSKRAEDCLDSIFHYIREVDSEYSASTFINKIFDKTDSLIRNPNWAGVEIRDLPVSGFRFILVSNYKIVYAVHGKNVEIVAVVHKARLLKDFFESGEA